jgi:uncharacterized protein (TIGR00255 family)
VLKSMTGYGHDSRTCGPLTFTVDLKTVNHRYLEIVFRLPREWSMAEERLRRKIQQRLKRGRVEVSVSVERAPDAVRDMRIDWVLAEQYARAAEMLSERFGISLDRRLTAYELLGLPGIITESDEELPADAEDVLASCVESALLQVMEMREKEGKFLADDARRKLSGIGELIRSMRKLSPEVVNEYRAQLHERISRLLDGSPPLDAERLAQEVAIFAERSAIDEELTRLESHVSHFESLLASEEPVGRKLDFLLQEMNREANTIGSKANHAGLSALAVELKSELEKLREQIQNIE